MGSFCADEEECQFFDAPESIGQFDSWIDDWAAERYKYDMWIQSPKSVRERRMNFFHCLSRGIDGIIDINGTFPRNSVIEEEEDEEVENEEECSSSRSYGPSSSSAGVLCSLMEEGSTETFIPTSVNLDCRISNASAFSEPAMESSHPNMALINGMDRRILNRVKSRWMSRLRSMTCIYNEGGRTNDAKTYGLVPISRSRLQRVKVRQCNKRQKELSAVFTGQEILAHDGSISAMKFSHDGQYLASAGEDQAVRVWQVVSDERSNKSDLPDLDPSCIYFTVNRLSQLEPVSREKGGINKSAGIKKSADSACVVFPPRIFRILEKPLHVFLGHKAEISDLSWAKNNSLLSCSVDKTVRLWQVGFDQCLQVFSHTNYVSCVQFNPVNDDYFISSSIDGKIRIWTVSGAQVVDWTEVKDIVTAVSYRPDGQGGVIGSTTGTCRFFNVTDNRVQLESDICLISKKKSLSKRITGFQFDPRDASKVMVTLADSQVRIICGKNVVTKYKGPRNAGNLMSASITSDGKHIISSSEDSNVYVWNRISPEESSASKPKVMKSFEFFPSGNASIAIPWPGTKLEPSHGVDDNNNIKNALPFSISRLDRELFLEATVPKGSATWPEEKLPAPTTHHQTSAMCKSQYRFLKNSCKNTSSSHAWGLVIVTAGQDGRIRSFHNYGLPVPL
ncbi:unnamed protein product [Cuscuta campestris]|uniref:Anaphase-promoting complex subunit 4 WD40 domain-containing protein n=1 Tax=Cuscuta campestris TaxID=132261 RepID=A0A484L8E5_9ASTE|nr:unnamed protein product [Cuscuta campestris]